jgi:hypothetical protein
MTIDMDMGTDMDMDINTPTDAVLDTDMFMDADTDMNYWIIIYWINYWLPSSEKHSIDCVN